MKKFSTAGFIFAFASTLAPLTAVAQAAKAADAAAPAAVKPAGKTRCEFLPNAPDQHKVVRGDTLWGISGKFLQHPWCWPQVWDINKDQIKNPHWIYPGQIVYFDRAAGRLRLGNLTGGTSSDVRLSPQVRVENLGLDAIPAIPTSAIEPFLSQPLAVDEDSFANSPRIVAVQEGRVLLGKGDKAYVRGDLKDGTAFQVFRPGRPLIDPDTKAVLAHEATYLGTIKLDRAAKTGDEAHRFLVATSKEEMGVGDRMLPVPPTPIMNYMPHAPNDVVSARVVAVYGGVSQAGQNQIVSINRGSKHGVDVGTVLTLYRFGGTIADRTAGGASVKLPDEEYGHLFVFRVFNNISYALIMQVTDVVQVGDVAKSPE